MVSYFARIYIIIYVLSRFFFFFLSLFYVIISREGIYTIEAHTCGVDYDKARRFALSSIHTHSSVQSPLRDRPAE